MRIGSAELPPFWGASLRFAVAAILFSVAVAVWRLPLPRGKALIGPVLFGIVGFALSYALFYWGVIDVEAGLAQVLFSMIPLFTLLLAVAHGVERLVMRAVVGTVLAMAGVVVVSADQLSVSVPLLPMLAVIASAAAAAESSVLVKAFPGTSLVTFNAVSMAVGAVLLLALSVLAGERIAVPQQPATWLSLGYLITVGSIGLFLLYLYVLRTWTASASSYMFVLAPFVTVAIGALFLGERLSGPLAVGAALVLIGVYVGALSPTAPAAPPVVAAVETEG